MKKIVMIPILFAFFCSCNLLIDVIDNITSEPDFSYDIDQTSSQSIDTTPGIEPQITPDQGEETTPGPTEGITPSPTVSPTPAPTHFTLIQSNPSDSIDIVTSIKIDDSYMYIGGYSTSIELDRQWRLEKRNKRTGVLVSDFGAGGVVEVNPSVNNEAINSLAIDECYIYPAGSDLSLGTADSQFRIEKWDIISGDPVAEFGTEGVFTCNNFISGVETLYSITCDADYLYLGGADAGGTGMQWNLHKRDIITGNGAAGFGIDGILKIDPSTGSDYLFSVRVDSSYIYCTGSSKTNSGGSTDYRPRVEKRMISDACPVSAFNSGGFIETNPSLRNDMYTSSAFDSNYIYLLGHDEVVADENYRWFIEKRDITTGIQDPNFNSGTSIYIDPSGTIDQPDTILVDDCYIYVSGFDETAGSTDRQWRLEKRDIITGEPVYTFGTNGVLQINPSVYNEAVGEFVIDNESIYIVGSDYSFGSTDSCWRIEKRSKETGAYMN